MRIVIAALTLPLFLMTGCAQDGGSPVGDRIRAVETGLPEANFEAGVPWDGIGRLPGTSSLIERMEYYGVPGVSIAVVDDSAIDWAKGYGVLEAGGSDSVTTETLFEAASTTKTATAVAVLHLVSRGRLDLDEDVNLRLTSWRVPESELTVEEKVTARRLLIHTAGINRPDGGFSVSGSGSPTTVQVLNGEPPAANLPLTVEFVPGTRYQYSNFGYIVLQQLIEDVALGPYARVMRETVFEPIGMRSSTFDPGSGADATARPKPHGTQGEPLESLPHPSALGQGGLWTTPSDLGLLAVEIMESYHGRRDRVLSQEIARLALTTALEIDPAQSMGFSEEGLGVALLPTEEGPAFCHPGFNAPGATCILIGFPDTGQGAAVMTNGANGLQLSFEVVSSIAAEYSWPGILAGRGDD
jgi:CubicO group peptidase (beta-lactamase class C family)